MVNAYFMRLTICLSVYLGNKDEGMVNFVFMDFFRSFFFFFFCCRNRPQGIKKLSSYSYRHTPREIISRFSLSSRYVCVYVRAGIWSVGKRGGRNSAMAMITENFTIYQVHIQCITIFPVWTLEGK